MQKSTKDFVFVGIQLGLFITYALVPKLGLFEASEWLHNAGVLMAFVGFAFVVLAIYKLRPSLSVYPSPRAGGKLITTGVYSKFRHPIYTGLLISLFGYGLYQDSILKLLVTVLIFVLFWFKARYEESRLTLVFDDYEQYKKRSWMFFPGL